MNENNHVEPSYEPRADESRSLDLLHEDQEAALHNDLETVMAKLEQSLTVAKKGNDLEWVAYLEGILSYLRGNLTELRSHTTSAGANTKILSRLAEGLEYRGSSHYQEDYGA